MTSRKDIKVESIPAGSVIQTYGDNTAWVVTPEGARYPLRSLAVAAKDKPSHCESCGLDVTAEERSASIGKWGQVFCAFCEPQPKVPLAPTLVDSRFCSMCKGSGCACHFGVDGHPVGLIGWSPCPDCGGTGQPPMTLNVGDVAFPVVPPAGDGGEEITTC